MFVETTSHGCQHATHFLWKGRMLTAKLPLHPAKCTPKRRAPAHKKCSNIVSIWQAWKVTPAVISSKHKFPLCPEDSNYHRLMAELPWNSVKISRMKNNAWHKISTTEVEDKWSKNVLLTLIVSTSVSSGHTWTFLSHMFIFLLALSCFKHKLCSPTPPQKTCLSMSSTGTKLSAWR